MEKIDLAGQRFGALLAIGESGKTKHGNIKWLCVCDCGREKVVASAKLRQGQAVSCGCLKAELCAAANIKHGNSARGRMTAEYRAWCNIIDRCENPSRSGYEHYGARGVSICREWRESFAAFLRDVGNRPTPEHSIDRIDFDGNYEPGNVRWATRVTQARNRSCTRWLEYNGEVRCLSEWSLLLGIKKTTLFQRLRRMSVRDAFETPVRKICNTR